MADSNEHPIDETLEDESRAEGEMNNVSLDEESGYTEDYTQEKESKDIPKTRSWRKGWMKKKDATDPVEEESTPTTTKKVVVKSDLTTECNSFGAGLLNFCTFGLVSSGETVIVTEEVEGEQPISAEKIVEDLAVSEAQLTMIDEETTMTSPSVPGFNPRSKSIMSVHSVHSAHSEKSEGDAASADSTSVGSMLSKIINEQKRKTLVFKVVGIVIFVIMSGLFITGGILFKRNGW